MKNNWLFARSCWFITFRFYLKFFIQEQISELKTYLLAPIYFHFGHYPLVMDILTLGQEMGEIIFIFLLVAIFIARLVYYRNYYFQVFSSFYFHLTNLLPNRQSLFNYTSSFFTSLKSGISFFFTKIKSFFKKRK